MRRIFVFIAIISFYATCGIAQTDVTQYFLANYAFDEGFDHKAGETTDVTKEIADIPSWTPGFTVKTIVAGVYEFGFAGTFNGAKVPAAGFGGEKGGGLALSSGFSRDFFFTQEVTLPAGKYTLQAPIYNGCDVTAGVSLLAWIPDEGTAVTSELAEYPANTWTLDQISFTTESEMKGKIRIGYRSAAGGGTNSARIVIDYLRLLTDGMTVDKTPLKTAIDAAMAYYGDGSGNESASLLAAIEAATSVLNADNVTLVDVNNAIESLQKAIEEYRQHNVSETNPYDCTDLLQNNSFEKGTTEGWTVSNLALQTNNSFTQKDGNYYLEKWVSSGGAGNASLTQTVQMPAGIYILKAAAQNYDQSAANVKCSGAVIFADNQQCAVTSPAEYSVRFITTTGQVKLGFKATSASGNWLAVDNFRLYQVGNADAVSLKKELSQLIGIAESLTQKPMSETALGNLNAAIETSTQALEASESDVISTIYMLSGIIDATEIAIARADFEQKVQNPLPFSGTEPAVTMTNHYVPTGATEAVMRATMTGSELMERGVCWSTTHNPTVLDDRTTAYWNLNGSIYHITGLKPATVYYLRPYAMNKYYHVAYGDEVKIVTLPKGTGNGTWDEGAPNEEANNRCRTAIREAIEYLNEWTGIQGFTLSGHYGSGTQTADCSYGGWMRIGPNASYQATGTVLHETGHGVGVGTSDRWSDKNVHDWVWKGRETTRLYKFLENKEGNSEYYMVGDTQHGWGQNATYDWYINGADKDKHQPLQYAGCSMLLHAMFIDGLCPTNSYHNGMPGYTYNFEEGKKYYIMCKAADRGLGVGLLCKNGTSIALLKSMLNTTEEVSDDAAWYLSFNPQTRYYTFQNVANGLYLSTAHGAGIGLKSFTQPTSTEYFQLMPDRTDVTLTSEAGSITTHGYWITWYDDSSRSNKAVSANANRYENGSLTVAGFDYSDAATRQQWIIIPEEELETYRAIYISTAIREVRKTSSNAPSVIYNIDGTVASPAQGGLKIMRRNDGTTMKIYR